MKIAIIGWYGTETIGDRAILAGLFNIFAESYGSFEVLLGCLGTLLSERTIIEDSTFFSECSCGKIKNITLFDSRNIKELDNAILASNIIAIGGGPLMELDEMYMLLYAFVKAKKKSKTCIVAGCGMGPFKTKEKQKLSARIIDLSDIAVFRDRKSQEIYNSLSFNPKKTTSIIDPAVLSARCYRLKHPILEREDNYIAVNFRKPPVMEYSGLSFLDEYYFVNLLFELSKSYDNKIRLVPMHTYDIGGDDRFYLNKIARLAKIDNVVVENCPLSLEETMAIYAKAFCCIGMRFHSILLQTVLNGYNYILDYTDPQKGKIISLIDQLSLRERFRNRYISLVKGQILDISTLNDIDKITVSDQYLDLVKGQYVDAFKIIH